MALVRRGAQLSLPRVHEIERRLDEVVLRLGQRAPLTVDLQLGQPDLDAGLLGEHLRRKGKGRGQQLCDLGGVGEHDLGAGAPPDKLPFAATRSFHQRREVLARLAHLPPDHCSLR